MIFWESKGSVAKFLFYGEGMASTVCPHSLHVYYDVLPLHPTISTLSQERGRSDNSVRNRSCRTSLVAQWLRICLPMQGTWVRSMVWGDSTCHGATKPVYQNY